MCDVEIGLGARDALILISDYGFAVYYSLTLNVVVDWVFKLRVKLLPRIILDLFDNGWKSK